MEPTHQTIRILDLSDEARTDLSREIPADLISFEEIDEGDSASTRDITTTTVIIVVSEVAVRLLALWITRHTTREETEVSIQTESPTGSKKTIHIRSKSGSSQSEAAVLKQLAAVCKLDIKDLESSGETTPD